MKQLAYGERRRGCVSVTVHSPQAELKVTQHQSTAP